MKKLSKQSLPQEILALMVMKLANRLALHTAKRKGASEVLQLISFRSSAFINAGDECDCSNVQFEPIVDRYAQYMVRGFPVGTLRSIRKEVNYYADCTRTDYDVVMKSVRRGAIQRVRLSPVPR